MEVLVQWEGREWEGQDSWVPLQNNEELRSYLFLKKGNPHSSTLEKGRCTARPQGQKIFNFCDKVFLALGEPKPTVEDGYRYRTTVSVPFSARSLQDLMRSLDIPFTSAGNLPWR